MSDLPATRASDAERDQVVERLREASAEGRLTLEELSERTALVYVARTHDELDDLVRDLPEQRGERRLGGRRRRATRLLVALFGSTERGGSLHLRRWVTCFATFGNIDLDLREATLDADVINIVIAGIFCTADVYVPEGVEVDLRGFALFGHARANGNDPPPRPGTPLVRVLTVSLFGGIDVWRVPKEWAQRTWRDVINGIRKGEHKQLDA